LFSTGCRKGAWRLYDIWLGTDLVEAVFMQTQILTLKEYSPQLAEMQTHFSKHLVSTKIHMRGNKASLDAKKNFSVAIVGTRMPSEYGYTLVKELVKRLAPHQFNIVSGGAFGIDAEAHEQALERGLATRAWLVGPVADPAPRSHRGLFEKIARSEGSALLVPDFLEVERIRQHLGPRAWLARNSWIVADADVVVIIEAAIKSGTWQTAKDALDMGKSIYLLPGKIFSKTSQGTNRMISRGYGEIVCDLDQLTETLVVRAQQNTYNKS
jgi:DNA processing protein